MKKSAQDREIEKLKKQVEKLKKEKESGENGAFPPTRNGCIHSLSMRERG